MSSRTKKRLKAARKEATAALGQSYISRNDPCPCGSGKKAKHCCLNKIKMLKALPPAVREQLIANSILGQPAFVPQPVPAAVAEQFVAVQAQAAGAASVEAQVGPTDAPVDAPSVDATALPVDAPIAASEPITLPIVSATIQSGDGGDPIQLTGGTITLNPPETTETPTP